MNANSLMATASATLSAASLIEAALRVLNTAEPCEKARITRDVVASWRLQELTVSPGACGQLPVPTRPARADHKVPSPEQPLGLCLSPCCAPSGPILMFTQVKLVGPGSMPRLGKGGTLASRQAIVHSLVHIESWAIDLSWDIIARFGQDPEYAPHLPEAFFDDFVKVRPCPSRPALPSTDEMPGRQGAGTCRQVGTPARIDDRFEINSCHMHLI